MLGAPRPQHSRPDPMKPPSFWTLVLRALGLETPRPMVASGDLSDAERLELARYLDH